MQTNCDLEKLHEWEKDEKWQYYTLVGFLRATFFLAVIISSLLMISCSLPGSDFALWQCAIPLAVYGMIFLLTWIYLNHRYLVRTDEEAKTVYLKKNTRVFFPFPKMKALFRDF